MSRLLVHLMLAASFLKELKSDDRTCYSCVYSYNGPGSDDTCVRNPSALPPSGRIKCPTERRCQINQQYDNAAGLVRSFQRGCDLLQWEGCKSDIYFITCNKFCDTDLCNNWDGTKPLLDSEATTPSSAGQLCLSIACFVLAFLINRIKYR